MNAKLTVSRTNFVYNFSHLIYWSMYSCSATFASSKLLLFSNPFFSECIFYRLQNCVTLWLPVWVDICILNKFHRGFSIYHLTFGDKILRELGFHIWNHLPETLKAELYFQRFKKSLSDSFGRRAGKIRPTLASCAYRASKVESRRTK